MGSEADEQKLCPTCGTVLRTRITPTKSFTENGTIQGDYYCPNNCRLINTGGGNVSPYPEP